MKLKNKKTGEIANWCIDKDIIRTCDGSIIYNSLAELNAEWEDYEEPKEFYIVDLDGEILVSDSEDRTTEKCKELGNYFETKEEAEKAVEKLKAWKRLKDKGFRFTAWYGGSKDILFSIPQEMIDRPTAKDLDLLFGVEE